MNVLLSQMALIMRGHESSGLPPNSRAEEKGVRLYVFFVKVTPNPILGFPGLHNHEGLVYGVRQHPLALQCMLPDSDEAVSRELQHGKDQRRNSSSAPTKTDPTA
eukprot:4800560-Amphidinium_carterae.1